ncbi:MAG: hypothetical protein GX937_05260 [Lentisphaerae bacterium]|jgi:hypothetical protein|nr:hypothetical protein [Lentisphaerota bacterium]
MFPDAPNASRGHEFFLADSWPEDLQKPSNAPDAVACRSRPGSKHLVCGCQPGEGRRKRLTRGDAKQSIQEAIDAAAEGDTILVNDGIYAPIDALNKAITIRSVNGPEKNDH